jgi:perosamine synthetase
MIPYGRQSIGEDDICAVVEVLRSDWLTTGPKVPEFEKAFADFVGTKEAVAVNSGTAALHAAVTALEIGPGDEVIVPAITFAATANCVVFRGATPVFADVDPQTLLIRPDQIDAKITSRTKAVIAVDYAGHPADYDAIRPITDRHGIALVADSCHALGASYKGRSAGSLTDLSVFSFHPVKHITTGEGGMITTDNENYAKSMRTFRNHGITTDHRQRESQGSWFYEMVELGYNYRLTDIQCALGLSQLNKVPLFLDKRRAIANRYDEVFCNIPSVSPLLVSADVIHAYHLYVVQLDFDRLGTDRKTLFQSLRQQGIGVNVHYIPVYLHPFYRNRFKTKKGLCPVSEAAYERILSLPIHAEMTEQDAGVVCTAFKEISNLG